MGETKWNAIDASSSSSSQPLPGTAATVADTLRLLIVRENQAEGEPKHWYLCLCRDGTDLCSRTFQVTGDATLMVYKSEEDVDRLHSSDYYTSYGLKAQLSQHDISAVEEAVRVEPPPQAPDRRSVSENCQGWTLRVLSRLAAQRLVKETDVEWIRRDWRTCLRLVKNLFEFFAYFSKFRI